MSVIAIRDFKIGYAEAGNDETPLIFLHGVGSDKSVWKVQLDFFAVHRRAIVFDYPGYGESDLPPKNLNRAEIAVYLTGAMDALGIKKAHFCGLSMGGVIALEIYRQEPERVLSLVLANTFARHPQGAEIVARSQKFLETQTMREFAEQRVSALLATQTSAEIRRAVVETMGRIDKRAYAWSSPAVWLADYRDLLPKINVSTLVIGAKLDQPTPPVLSAELAGNIPHAQLEIINDAGHLSNLDQPQIFNRLVERHLR